MPIGPEWAAAVFPRGRSDRLRFIGTFVGSRTEDLSGARHSGLVLQATGNSSGTDITPQVESGATSQQWRVQDHGGGTVSLINRASGLAMDVWERSTADGARISQWPYTGDPNQRFPRQRV